MTEDTLIAARITRIEETLKSEFGVGSRSPGRVQVVQARIAHRLEQLETQLHGGEGLGLKTRVLILWHSYVWVIAIAGALVGSVLTKLLDLL